MATRSAVSLAVIFGALTAAACSDEGARPAVPVGVCPVAEEARPGAADLTYDRLYAFVDEHRDELRSGYDLIACLPEELFQFYTLVHESRSAQQATPERPRVLLFHPSTDFFMSFAGVGLPARGEEEGKVGAMDFELVQYRAAPSYGLPAHRFDYHLILFDNDGELEATAPSQPNPPSCLDCHQNRPEGAVADPRPNWESYDQWAGVFGSDDDYLTLAKHPVYEQEPLDFAAERERLAAAQATSKARYLDQIAERLQLLDFVLDDGKPWPYSRLDYSSWRIDYDERTAYQHNSRVTQFLANLNFRRVARMMTSDPAWGEEREAVLKLLFSCETLAEDQPELLHAFARGRLGYFPDWSMEFRGDGDFSTPDYWPHNLIGALVRMDPSLNVPVVVEDKATYYGSLGHGWDYDRVQEFCRDGLERRDRAGAARETAIPAP